MYCRNCGTEIDDKAVICVNCGAQQVQNLPQSQVEDNPNVLLKILCFFIPIVGLILFLVMKDNQPISAKAYGKWALIGVIVEVVFSIIATVAGCALAGIIGASTGDFYY